MSTYLVSLAAAFMWLLCGVPSASAALQGQERPATESLQPMDQDVPQWEDLGLENLLITASQPSVSAPSSFRGAHQHAPFEVDGRMWKFRHEQSPVWRYVFLRRSVTGYLYLLLCLRL
ncbi:MAG: hypothetical protein J6I49_09210 [Bacteroidales bacterium]|nr:hypothetical protein [Bacteroidales bacterium]